MARQGTRKTTLLMTPKSKLGEIQQQTPPSPPPPATKPDEILETSGIEDYLNVSEENHELELAEKDVEIEELRKENLSLHNTIDILRSRVEELEKKLAAVHAESPRQNPSPTADEIAGQNHILAEVNKTLEADCIRYKESIATLKREVDTLRHTYTRPGYTGTPIGSAPFGNAQNGYQDWR